MNFDPTMLPPTVYEAYKQGPLAWIFVIKTAIDLEITDVERLTDIAFYLHHPDLNGEPLKVGDTKLIETWKNFRKLIRPLIPAFKKSSSKSSVKSLRQIGLSPHFAEPRGPSKLFLELEYQAQRLRGNV